MERIKQSPQFEPGDVVVLKSGGPPMTVDAIESNGRVKVTWFDKNELRSATFGTHQLEVVNDDYSESDFDLT